MPISGSVESISIDGRQWNVPADADITISMGGSKNEQKPNGGGATGRTVKETLSWKLAGAQLSINFADGDPAFLQNVANGGNVDVLIKLADLSTLNGTGNIEGELTFSSQNGTASMDLAGPGTLT